MCAVCAACLFFPWQSYPIPWHAFCMDDGGLFSWRRRSHPFSSASALYTHSSQGQRAEATPPGWGGLCVRAGMKNHECHVSNDQLWSARIVLVWRWNAWPDGAQYSAIQCGLWVTLEVISGHQNAGIQTTESTKEPCVDLAGNQQIEWDCVCSCMCGSVCICVSWPVAMPSPKLTAEKELKGAQRWRSLTSDRILAKLENSTHLLLRVAKLHG